MYDIELKKQLCWSLLHKLVPGNFEKVENDERYYNIDGLYVSFEYGDMWVYDPATERCMHPEYCMVKIVLNLKNIILKNKLEKELASKQAPAKKIVKV